MSSMLLPLQRYAQFSGRAGRREYWMFVLFTFLCNLTLYIISAVGASMDSSVIATIGALGSGLFALATLVPSLAVAVRRLHDTDRSGWFVLVAMVPIIGLVLVYFLIQSGTAGVNRFGDVPRD